MRTIALFNNKGGVGKTTLVYHLAHMFAKMDYPTLAVDLDPQANLSTMFFDEEILEGLWEKPQSGATIYSCIEPIMEGIGDIVPPNPIPISGYHGVSALCGDLRLSLFEDKLSDAWPRTFEKKPDALRVVSSFHRIIKAGSQSCGAKIALIDVGPNLGAINRAALLSADFIAVPLAADLFSLQGLRNLGPTIRNWRENWDTIKGLNKGTSIELPRGCMNPLGYIILQHSVRLDRPVKSYEKWLNRIPLEYSHSVLEEKSRDYQVLTDPYCLSMLRHYRSLIPMAQEARKPVFDLKPADGAIGSHLKLVSTAHDEFKSLAREMARRMKQPMKFSAQGGGDGAG